MSPQIVSHIAFHTVCSVTAYKRTAYNTRSILNSVVKVVTTLTRVGMSVWNDRADAAKRSDAERRYHPPTSQRMAIASFSSSTNCMLTSSCRELLAPLLLTTIIITRIKVIIAVITVRHYGVCHDLYAFNIKSATAMTASL